MLYERWRQIAREHRHEFALGDLSSGREWTFGQLATAADNVFDDDQAIVFPRGASADFILSTLHAWRANKVVCPLEAEQAPPSIPVLPKGIVHLKTTSASTGVARMVAFTAAQLAADAENIILTMGLRPEWPNIGVISLAHSYGFSNLITPLLLHGIPLILAGSPLPEALRRVLAGMKAATVAAVPALWRSWCEAGVLSNKIRLAISAGAPLPLSLEEEVSAQAGVKLHNFYGATECGGIAYDGSITPRADPSLVGAPMRNVMLSVNIERCLEVRSQAVGQTYWPVPDERLAGGCYRTSDLVELRDDEVFLCGRASDLVNVAGRKVSPEGIERVLLNHPHVSECLVFGAPSADAERGEMLVACVASRVGVTGGELKAFLLERLPAWQVPRDWRIVDALNVNQRGKLSRAEWRRRYLAGDL